MLRTAYSHILNSSRDFSIAICDAQARLLAQADHIPIHVGAMPFAVKAVVEAFGDSIESDPQVPSFLSLFYPYNSCCETCRNKVRARASFRDRPRACSSGRGWPQKLCRQ